MSHMVIKQQLEQTNALKELVDLVKNPKAILEANELARKEFELTESERVRAEDARKNIANNERILSEIEKKQEVLTAAAEQHSIKVEAFDKKSADLDKQIRELNTSMNEVKGREKELDKIQKELDAKASKLSILEETLSEKEARLREFDDEVQKRLAKVKLREKAADL